MNLLLVTDTYPPDINGVAHTLSTLTQALRRRGHRVEVVTTVEGLEADGRHVTRSAPLLGYPGLRVGFAHTSTLMRLIRESRAEILYVATETPLGLAAIRAARKLGIPVISGFHTNFQSYLANYKLPGCERLAKWLLKYVHNQTGRTLTPSVDSAAAIREWGIENVGVMGRGVDTELFHPGQRSAELRASWGVGDQDPVAIYVGRLAAEKNLPLAVKAIQRMRDVVPGVKGVFVGSGPLEESLRREHPEIHFAGARRGEELAQHYASADLFVFPSHTETFGNVVLEAMASGLAVLAFDYAAPQLLIRHSVNGFLVPFQDEAAFLEAAHQLAGRADLDALRREACATAKTHSWDHIVAQFEGEMNLLTATTSPQDT